MSAMTEETVQLWERYRANRDPDARSKLLDQYLGLVHHIARKQVRRTGGAVELDDLVSAGMLGLVLALDGFDPGRGLAFSTYATPRINGAILDELRGRDWVPRSVRSKRRKIDTTVETLSSAMGRQPTPEEVAAALEITVEQYYRWREDVESVVMVSFDTTALQARGNAGNLEEMLSDPSQVETVDTLTREEEVAAVRDAIAELTKKERIVLALYYYEELTLKQIAEILHLTESRISQIRSQSLRRLRGVLATTIEG